MAAPGPANIIARRVTDDLIAFSGETAPRRYMKLFLTQKLAESHRFVNRMRDEANTIRECVAQLTTIVAELQVMSDQDEVHDSLLAAKDAKRSKESKLVALNDVIAKALEDIDTQETNVEILDDENDGAVPILSWIWVNLDCSWCLQVMSIWTWSPANGLAVVKSIWTWSPANGLAMVMSIWTWIPANGLAVLVEFADSSRLQDKMKVVFVQARGADESFIALMRDLCSALRVSITKNRRLIAELEALGQRGEALKPLDYMKEMVGRDSATLGVLEQLLAGTHVGMRLKASYISEMEET
ncbi:hypothetical protein Tco_1097907 [Tanacetum coccineum]